MIGWLPPHLADEVSDGLADAHEKYIGQGLNPDQAARASIAEFGNAGVVAEAFRRACPAWRAARALIVTGPVVGGWWAASAVPGRNEHPRWRYGGWPTAGIVTADLGNKGEPHMAGDDDISG